MGKVVHNELRKWGEPRPMKPQLGDVVLFQLNRGEMRMAHVVYVRDADTLNLMVFPAFGYEDFKLIEGVVRGGSVGQWILRPVEVRP